MKSLKLLAVCVGLSLAIASPAFAKYGTIIIKKQAMPHDPQDFAFSISNYSPSGFFLDDDNNPTLSNQKTIVTIEGNYTVTESITPGWKLKSIRCTSQNGNNNNTIHLNGRNVLIRLEYNETVTCTFVNETMSPTAADITVSGKVLTANGSGISKALVKVTDLASGQVYSGVTSPFGYYTVQGPQAGSFIDISVSAKARQFRSVQLNAMDNVENLDFVEIRSKSMSKIISIEKNEENIRSEKTLEQINEEIFDARSDSENNK